MIYPPAVLISREPEYSKIILLSRSTPPLPLSHRSLHTHTVTRIHINYYFYILILSFVNYIILKLRRHSIGRRRFTGVRNLTQPPVLFFTRRPEKVRSK